MMPLCGTFVQICIFLLRFIGAISQATRTPKHPDIKTPKFWSTRTPKTKLQKDTKTQGPNKFNRERSKVRCAQEYKEARTTVYNYTLNKNTSTQF